MKTIIAGSRSLRSLGTVQEAVALSGIQITEVVSGCARGVDRLGEELARRRGIPVRRFPADWEQHGRSAGVIRNLEMAEYAEALIAVWDGRSRGTRHMIECASRRKLRVFVFTHASGCPGAFVHS